MATAEIDGLVQEYDLVEEFDMDKLKEYDFPFTNIVLEGGGSKGMAYVGALQVFEAVGISEKIKRICGASAGAIVGTLLAIGYDSKKLKEFLNQDIEKILIDHKWGLFSLIPNLLSGYGWNPGNKMLEWFGKVLEEATGNADITFHEIYQKHKRELCIIVTNLSHMSTEYLHVKTTPQMPVRIAVRMSMSIPGVFQSVKYRMHHTDDLYIDGGLLCNYPIHAFDGWWLSMEPENSFFAKFRRLKDCPKLYAKSARFGGWNQNTLGLLLFSNTETELMRERLSGRPGNTLPKQPDSKLYKARKAKRLEEQQLSEHHLNILKAVGRFVSDLVRLGFDKDQVITLDELEEAFEKAEEFTKEDRMLLFETENFKEAFKQMDRNEDDKITFHEMKMFVESKGVDLQQQFLGYRRKEIKSLGQFLVTLESALDINCKRNYVEDKDILRTIGIDTDYIESTDFALEMADKEFLIESGRAATIAFLRNYIKPKPRLSSVY